MPRSSRLLRLILAVASAGVVVAVALWLSRQGNLPADGVVEETSSHEPVAARAPNPPPQQPALAPATPTTLPASAATPDATKPAPRTASVRVARTKPALPYVNEDTP